MAGKLCTDTDRLFDRVPADAVPSVSTIIERVWNRCNVEERDINEQNPYLRNGAGNWLAKSSMVFKDGEFQISRVTSQNTPCVVWIVTFLSLRGCYGPESSLYRNQPSQTLTPSRDGDRRPVLHMI